MTDEVVGITVALSSPGTIALFRAVTAQAERLKGPAKSLTHNYHV